MWNSSLWDRCRSWNSSLRNSSWLLLWNKPLWSWGKLLWVDKLLLRLLLSKICAELEVVLDRLWSSLLELLLRNSLKLRLLLDNLEPLRLLLRTNSLELLRLLSHNLRLLSNNLLRNSLSIDLLLRIEHKLSLRLLLRLGHSRRGSW